MKAIKNFDEFIRPEIVKKQNPDKSRAEFLIKEAEKAFKGLNKRLNSMGIDDDNVNSIIKDCYDIIMELIRAKLLLDGYSASGYHAHEAEVSYMRILTFNEKDVQFIDQMRFFRNGILYYGTRLDKEYAEKVVEFTKRIYVKLKKIIKL